MSYTGKKETIGEPKSTNVRGDDAMSNSVMPYAALDLHALGKKNVKIVSSEEALKDVVPIAWGEDILQGREKVIAAKEKNEEPVTNV